MKKIRIADITLSKAELSFREKVELVKYLDRLGVSVIETGVVPSDMAESLFVKTAASSVKESVIAVPAGLDESSISKTWDYVKNAVHPRLQVCIPLSTSQMEYVLHKKSNTIASVVAEAVSQCRKYCEDVEFVALDATRSDFSLLIDCIKAAVDSGAGTVTLCDNAGSLLVEDAENFVKSVKESIDGLDVSLGVAFSNDIGLADALSIAAIKAGVQEIKVCCNDNSVASLGTLSKIIQTKGDSLGAEISVRNTEINRILENIGNLFSQKSNSCLPAVNFSFVNDTVLTKNETIEEIQKQIESLGYELSESDISKVFSAFKKAAERKSSLTVGELEAIIASEAMQVVQTYNLENYIVTCSNSTDILAHIKLKKNNEIFDGLAIGDGPIDAAFRAIEKITGCHYELDDFQIQSITQGREAMGQTVVKLRSEGKIFSGRGISTDIIGSGILAYLSALNKIVWEDES